VGSILLLAFAVSYLQTLHVVLRADIASTWWKLYGQGFLAVRYSWEPSSVMT
jgi:hypothetical protein